jgi:hypothetical protein
MPTAAELVRYVPEMSRPRRFVLLALVATLFAWSTPPANGQNADSSLLGVERQYLVGDHGETGFVLKVSNRYMEALRLSFYVLLPASHPAVDTLFATPDTSFLATEMPSQNCAGLQYTANVQARDSATFKSCLFDRVALNETYVVAVAVRDSQGHTVDSLNVEYPITDQLYR